MSRMFFKTFIIILSVLLIAQYPEYSAFAENIEAEVETIYECDFENDSILKTHEWYAFGDGDVDGIASGLKAEIDPAVSHSGKSSMKVSNRGKNWMGPGFNVLNQLKENYKYQISVYARHDRTDTMAMKLNLKVEKNGATRFVVLDTKNAKPGEWVELSGEFWMSSGYSNIELYVDSDQEWCNEYIDDFVIKNTHETVYASKNPDDYGKPIVTWNFEDNNLDTWKDNGVSTLVCGSSPEKGNYLKVRNGRANKGGCSVSLQPYYDSGWTGVFYFTGYIYLAGADDQIQTFTVSQITQNSNGVEKTVVIDMITIFPNEWVGFASELNLSEDTQTLSIAITGPEVSSFYLDDVSFSTDEEITRSTEDNLVNVDKLVSSFEKDNDMWVSKDGARLVRTDEFSKKGSYSLYVDSRENSKSGMSLFLSMLEKNVNYHYSCYIRYEGEDVTNTHEFYIKAETLKEGKKVYSDIGHGIVKKGKWCQISGNFTIPEKQKNINCIISSTNDNIEGDATISFYIDDIEICKEEIYRAKAKTRIVIFALILAAVAALIILLIRMRMKSTRKLKSSKIDSMTKAYNRNTYEEVLKEFELHPEKCVGLYFAVCDLNHLKYINDNFGHSFGDDAIMRCAALLLRACGSNRENKVYRIGGDEFVVVSKKNIRAEINIEIRKEKEIKKEYPFNVAVGYATFNTIEDGEIPNISSIIKRADEEMYRNKEQMKKEDNIEPERSSDTEKQ